MSFDHTQLVRRINPSAYQVPKSLSPSWAIEREALANFASETGRAILAIFHARRDARSIEFHVPPLTGALYGLDKSTLNRALGRLNGCLVEILRAEHGKPREFRLLAEWENPEAIEADPLKIFRELRAKGMGVDDEDTQGGFDIEV